MTPLESAQAIVEKWYSQENGKAYLVELIAVELERRDEAVKEVITALTHAVDTIDDEFCGSGTHHSLCDIPRTALEQYRKQNEGGVSE